ncbi:MAG TPA: hypothetical protein VGK17_17240 [Propionicimonas sp.]
MGGAQYVAERHLQVRRRGTVVAELLEDVWATRDLPVLAEATRLIDRGGVIVDVDGLVRGLGGIDTPDVIRALRALERRGFVSMLWMSTHGESTVTDVSGDAYLVTGLHPDGADAVDRLVAAIHQAAELVDDPDERSRLQRLADGVVSVGRDIIGNVLASVITTTTLGR